MPPDFRPPARPRTRDWRSYDARREGWETYDPDEVYEQLVLLTAIGDLAFQDFEAEVTARDRREQARRDRAQRVLERIHSGT